MPMHLQPLRSRRRPLRVALSVTRGAAALLPLLCCLFTLPALARPVALSVVAVVDTTGGGHGPALARRVGRELARVEGAKVVSRTDFARAARRKGISSREWLEPASLSVLAEQLGLDYVVVGRLTRLSAWDFELRLVALTPSRKKAAEVSVRASMELRGGKEAPAVSEQAIADALRQLVAAVPPSRGRAAAQRPPVEPDAPAPPAEPPPEGDVAAQEDATGDDASPATDDDARDAAFFGDEELEPGDAGDFDPLATLAAAEAAYTVGGRLLLATTYFIYDEQAPWLGPWSAPSFAELHADARPSDRVRAFVQGRLDYDFTIPLGSEDPLGRARAPVDLRLDQLWVSFDLFRVAYFTLGRQRIRWGTGRIWNPTDFLHQQRRDSLDVLDRRLGLDLLKLHVPFELLGLNTYAIARVQEAFAPATAGLALRSEMVLGTTELSASGSFGFDQPVRVGADISSGLWIFDLRAELAAVWGDKQLYYRGRFDDFRGLVPKGYSREEDVLLSGVLGLEAEIPYWDQSAAIVGVEYFYNGAGYDGANLYPWILAKGEFSPLYMGRHYAAAYLNLTSPFSLRDVSFTVTNVGNLSDLSFLTRFDLRTQLLTFIQLAFFTVVHYGQPGELRLPLDLQPMAELPALKAPVKVPAPLADVGVVLLIDF